MVSRRMQRPEEERGGWLFEKVRLGYALNTAGERLLASAQRMEQEALEIDETVDGQDAELSGPLRGTAINDMASSVLLPMFTAFIRQLPAVVLHVMVSNTDLSLLQREGDVTIHLTNTPTDTLIGKRATMVASAI
jgi:DNA-binding transcriptional LysR family regulator